MQNQPGNDSIKKQTTLSEFIEDNHKLITTLGVFTALTIFTKTQTTGQISGLLSFLCLSMALLIWVELWRKIPRPSTFSLQVFEILLSIFVIGLALNYLLEYRRYWPDYLMVLITFVIISGIALVMNRTRILENQFFARRKRFVWFSRLFGLFLIILILWSSYVIASYLTPFTVSIFDWFVNFSQACCK